MSSDQRQKFIEQFRHELGGMILDAATSGRTGAELSFALRGAMRKIDIILGRMYDQFHPEPAAPATAPAANGAAHPRTK